jgi:hypothetical protein
LFLLDSKVFQVAFHFFPHGGELGIEFVDFLLNGVSPTVFQRLGNAWARRSILSGQG